MKFQSYLNQVRDWPQSGRHIMAQFDADSICVYQAYRPSIARFAVEHQQFGGDFSFSRMSWIKPNFLWMMYRSGWAAKEGQEHILAVRLKRTFFDELLGLAVPSSFDSRRFATLEEWKSAVAESDVRLQWDPDHDPAGKPLDRRAVQLGLRGNALRRFGEQELLSIEDITPFVAQQRSHAICGFTDLQIPVEHVYLPAGRGAAIAIGIECN
jgi:Domain of unknown function (DUF4291)